VVEPLILLNVFLAKDFHSGCSLLLFRGIINNTLVLEIKAIQNTRVCKSPIVIIELQQKFAP